jgi:hypothetical protein
VTGAILALFALARRPCGIGVLAWIGSWIAITTATQWNYLATLPIGLAIAALSRAIAAKIRDAAKEH